MYLVLGEMLTWLKFKEKTKRGKKKYKTNHRWFLDCAHAFNVHVQKYINRRPCVHNEKKKKTRMKLNNCTLNNLVCEDLCLVAPGVTVNLIRLNALGYNTCVKLPFILYYKGVFARGHFPWHVTFEEKSWSNPWGLLEEK